MSGGLPAVVAGLVTVLLLASPAAARDYQRVHLLSSDTHHLYWSVDPDDPELQSDAFSRSCGNPQLNGTPEGRPCLSGTPVPGQFWHTVYFLPGSIFDTDPTWNAEQPLRFRLELSVTPAVAHTVHLGVERGGAQAQSAPATEVAPGVWEGAITAPGSIGSNSFDMVYIRVKTPAPRIRLEVLTGGRSYLDLPAPVAGSSVPDLLAEDVHAPGLQTASTAQRQFEFSDGAWALSSFEGDLAEPRDFEVTLERPAAAVLAWVEAYESPMLHDVIEGDPPDTRKFTDGARVRVLRDGTEVVRGGGFEGRGQDAAAAVSVPAGPLTLRVEPTGNSQGHPYTAHVLVVEGERTLRRMRWVFNVAARPTPGFSLPSAVSCLPGTEPVPATTAVRSIALDLDWSGPGPTRWTPRFAAPDAYASTCGQDGTGDRVRLTMAGARIWGTGAVPSRDWPGASVMDTIFAMDARFTYGAL